MSSSMDDLSVSALRSALDGVTDGEWKAGHLCEEGHSCDCASILSEGYMGAIATVHLDNGKSVEAGGNDAPTLSEAKANQRFIAAFNPVVAKALLDEREALLKRIADLEKAGERILPYLKWTISDESPYHHPTLPSAAGAFNDVLNGDQASPKVGS